MGVKRKDPESINACHCACPAIAAATAEGSKSRGNLVFRESGKRFNTKDALRQSSPPFDQAQGRRHARDRQGRQRRSNANYLDLWRLSQNAFSATRRRPI